MIREITACRACGSANLEAPVVDLGLLSLSDWPASPLDPVDRAPLALTRCAGCALVQLTHSVDRERLYTSAYGYRSGLQEAMVAALADVVADARARVDLEPGDVVLDIGANDGTLLRQYPRALGLVKVAYEPVEAFRTSLNGDIRLAGAFFPTVIGGRPTRLAPPAKVITSVAMFYDVDDVGMFLEGIRASLAPDGVWINQLSYFPETSRQGNFGDVCHEHRTYWTLDGLAKVYAAHGLAITDYAFNDVNGGSVRVTAQHRAKGLHRLTGSDDAVTTEDLRRFRDRITRNTADVRTVLDSAWRDRRLVLGYGASTKGSTYLQVWGVGPDLLPAIAERNPAKVGRYTVTGIPILGEAGARALGPDQFLALPFQFLPSFLERERAFLARGGTFLVPFPSPHDVGLGALPLAA
jgi:cyclopropane fatty-acyl-phospholipid synthase-like methyltransferase